MPEFVDHYGPWALIAGASEGIGEAFAQALARRGMKLILLARREDKLRATAAAIARGHGVEVETLACDLGDPELATRVRAAVGAREVGLLIYNAAYSRVGGFFEQSLEDKLRALDVNCRGPLILSHVLGEAMLARGRGGIVLMGSLAGEQGSPRLATYAASKAFDRVLAESLWGELRGRGVDVLACVAGATRTPGFEAVASTAKGPVMEPAAVVEAALAQLGREPSMIPGLGNRLGALVLKRLPNRLRIRVMDIATRGSGGSRED
ncbi:MAG: SDR family NAD(P)-dependent oxidoreductase [Enhygromyxa sp.]